MCTSHCTYSPTRLAAVQAQRGGFMGLRPLPPAPLLIGIQFFLIGFWGYFSVFWNSLLMISGSNLGGLPPPEHLWDLLGWGVPDAPKCDF